MSDNMLATPLDNLLLPADALAPETVELMETLVRHLRAEQASPILSRNELEAIRLKFGADIWDDLDAAALIDHADAIADSYEDLVRRSAEEADRAQALVLRKEEEIAAHDDLHRAAAKRIEQLVRQLALTNEALDGSRDVLRRALIALREPMTQTDCRRAREILQTHHNECARAAAKARREPTHA